LQSGFFQATTNLRVVAAIVVILPDTYLEQKIQKVAETFIVTQEDGGDLWTSHPGLETQTWVYAAKEKKDLE